MDKGSCLRVAAVVIVLCYTAQWQAVEGSSNVTSPHLGADCTDDEQCSGTKPATSCRSNKCVACTDASGAYHEYSNCTDKHGCALHEYDGKCWKIRDIGEPCSVNEECWIYPTANITRLCDGNICVCNEADQYVYVSSPLVGVDKCYENGTILSADEMTGDDVSAENSGSSCRWSVLVAVLGTTLGAIMNVKIV